MNFLDPRLPERFWDKCIPEPVSSCWLWVGYAAAGYGRFTVGERRARAHCYAYEALVNLVPDGLELDHRCRNTLCVNPAHLEPVTHAENVRRGRVTESNTLRVMGRTHCRRGHEMTPQNTSFRGHYRDCKECCRYRDSKRVRSQKAA